MHTKDPRGARFFIFCLVVMMPIAAAAQPDLTQLVLGAPLIFRGTVIGVDSPTLPLPPPKGRLFRVRVDETLRGASTVGDFAGQEIVVLRTASSDRNVALFFVRPVAYGRTLAAEEIGEIDAPANTRAFAAEIAKIEQGDAENKLVARLSSAEAVVTGRVMAIKPSRESRLVPSEHDPDWAVAQVLVVRGLKGQPKTTGCGRASCTEVVFARSDDIRWFRAPKLAVGQAAIFLLRPANPELLREGETPDVRYVLIDPDDLRPVSEEARLRELMKRLP